MNTNAVQVAPVNEFQSRWGYHPCNRETFLKLKRLHKAFWWHLRRSVAAERWNAKRPENRRGKEPQYLPTFAVPKKWSKWGDCYGMFRKVEEHQVRQLFQQARRPSATPVTVFSLETVRQIEAWLADVAKWESEFNHIS